MDNIPYASMAGNVIAASVKIRRKSFDAIMRSRRVICCSLSEDTKVGTTLSMVSRYKSVCANKQACPRCHLLYNTETVRIVSMKDVRAHEGEDWHDVMKHRLGGQSSQAGHQQEGLMKCWGFSATDHIMNKTSSFGRIYNFTSNDVNQDIDMDTTGRYICTTLFR